MSLVMNSKWQNYDCFFVFYFIFYISKFSSIIKIIFVIRKNQLLKFENSTIP